MPSRQHQLPENTSVPPATVDAWLENQFDPWRGVQLVQRHTRALVIGAIVGAVLGFGIATMARPMYVAVTAILVANATTPAATLTSRTLLQNQSLAAETIAALGLDRPPYLLTPQQFTTEVLTLEEVRGANIFRVHVVLPDADMAAETSRQFSQRAVELSRRLVFEEGDALRTQLKRHLDDAAERSRIAEQQLLAFEQVAQVEVLKNQIDAMLKEREKLLALEVEIAAERARLAAAEAEIKKHSPLSAAPRDVDTEDALRRMAEAGAKTSPSAFVNLRNPNSNATYETLSFLIAGTRTRLAGLDRQWRELVTVRGLNGSHFSQLSDLYGRQLEHARLRASHDLSRQLHNDLAARYERGRALALENRVQLQIVDNAVRPDRPRSRRRGAAMMSGAVAGTLFAFVLSLAWHHSRARKSFARDAVRTI